MFEKLDELMYAGLGAVSMTREKAEKIFDEYVERGKADKSSKSGFVKEMMDNAEENRKRLENMISEQVKKTVENLNLATKDDISRIEGKIDQLNNKG